MRKKYSLDVVNYSRSCRSEFDNLSGSVSVCKAGEKEAEECDIVSYETFLSRAVISAISFRYGCCSRIMDKASRDQKASLNAPFVPLVRICALPSSRLSRGGSVTIQYNRTSPVPSSSFSLSSFDKRAVIRANNGIDMLDNNLFRLYFDEGRASE